MLVLTTNDSGVVEGGAGAVNVKWSVYKRRQLLKIASLSSPLIVSRSSFFELLKTRRGGMLCVTVERTGPAASI
jgi:hypothetical protein